MALIYMYIIINDRWIEGILGLAAIISTSKTTAI
jgi:hypothetical protein